MTNAPPVFERRSNYRPLRSVYVVDCRTSHPGEIWWDVMDDTNPDDPILVGCLPSKQSATELAYRTRRA